MGSRRSRTHARRRRLESRGRRLWLLCKKTALEMQFETFCNLYVLKPIALCPTPAAARSWIFTKAASDACIYSNCLVSKQRNHHPTTSYLIRRPVILISHFASIKFKFPRQSCPPVLNPLLCLPDIQLRILRHIQIKRLIQMVHFINPLNPFR